MPVEGLKLNSYKSVVCNCINRLEQEDEEMKGSVISSPLDCAEYAVIADYQPDKPGQIKLTEGSQVTVLEKKDTGMTI